MKANKVLGGKKMAKRKSFKIALIFSLLVVAISGMNMSTVMATGSKILENVPDIIEVGIPTTKGINTSGDMSSELREILTKKVEDKITVDMTGYHMGIYVLSAEERENKNFSDITKAKIVISTKTELIETKYITVKYSDNWNSADRKYVENKINNVDFDLKFTYTINGKQNFDQAITSEISKRINDKSIKGSFRGSKGSYWWEGKSDHLGETVIEKDGVIYGNVPSSVVADHKIIVPDTVEDTEEAYIDYALPVLKNYLASIESSIAEAMTLKKGTGKDVYDLDAGPRYGDGGRGTILIMKNTNDGTTNEVIHSIDNETKVRLDAAEGVVPDNTVLDVKAITSGVRYNSIKTALEDANKFVAFDINLLSDGVEIQPDGKVNISIPIPTDFDASKLVVYRIEQDGKKIEYKVTVVTIDGVKYAQFKTDHFSDYALVETKSALDSEPKTGVSNYTIYAGAIALLSMGGIVLLRRRKTYTI